MEGETYYRMGNIVFALQANKKAHPINQMSFEYIVRIF
jgi:hypothetical protein